MGTQSKNNTIASAGNSLASTCNRIDYMLKFFSTEDIVTVFEKMHDLKNHFQQNNLADVLTRLATPAGKKSFLVFKNHKYLNVLTENIAFFYVNMNHR